MKNENNNKLQRSTADNIIFGVCGGIAEYFNVDSTFVRLVALFFMFCDVSSFVLIYILLTVLIPLNNGKNQ